MIYVRVSKENRNASGSAKFESPKESHIIDYIVVIVSILYI